MLLSDVSTTAFKADICFLFNADILTGNGALGTFLEARGMFSGGMLFELGTLGMLFTPSGMFSAPEIFSASGIFSVIGMFSGPGMFSVPLGLFAGMTNEAVLSTERFFVTFSEAVGIIAGTTTFGCLLHVFPAIGRLFGCVSVSVFNCLSILCALFIPLAPVLTLFILRLLLLFNTSIGRLLVLQTPSILFDSVELVVFSLFFEIDFINSSMFIGTVS
mmetsp:Transcript_13510/g.13077  ORF Transcript_13510/g.13077 Transcript_13510/m.13077 type:complete len:218 (+) Transcript_13510:578-1231(+)